jgi:hypothetical protein
MSDWNKDRLTSWKEIAAFLGCDIRTCLRWEKERGLPVYRLDGGSRSRVFAHRAELEAWMKGKGSTAAPSANGLLSVSEKKASSRGSKSVRIAELILAVFGFAAILLFGAKALFSDRVPVDFRIEESKLIIVNREGQFLWDYDTGLETLAPDAYYRAHFNIKKIDEKTGIMIPLLHIRDIDGDGKNEILFCLKTEDDLKSGHLLCFDHRGKQRWEFSGGRDLIFGKSEISGDYSTDCDLCDFDQDGRLEIVVFSDHRQRFPTRITVLSPERDVIGDYWHSGRVLDYIMPDLDGDGKKELIISGTVNEFSQGFVAIFDPRKMGGASPSSGDFHCAEFGPGTEKAYFRFPWSEFDPIPSYDKSWASELAFQSNGRISAITWANGIIFDLDPKSLECRQVTLTASFIARHLEAVRAGRLSSVLNDIYKEKLRTGILYWTGREWTLTPTWIR